MSKQHIFISHSGGDREWARAFAKSLRERGVEVWLDEWQVAAGEPLGEAVEKALRESDTVAFIVTQENFQRPDLLFELGAAVGLGKRAVPIISKDVDASRLPYPLRVRRSLPKGSPDETAKQLLEGIPQ